MEDLEQAGLEAVDRFIDTWNSRDPVTWAGSLNYPHVRPAPTGPLNVAESAEAYASAVDYQQVLNSGWDHSEWDYKQVLHRSPRKIHVAGQWSRYNPAGEIILTTPIVYVCTKVSGNWGIQSRFAVDYADDDTDTTEMMSRSLNLVQDFINQYSAGNREACAELLNYPHIVVGVGSLDIAENNSDFTVNRRTLLTESLFAVQTGQHAMNAALELSVTDDSGTRKIQGVINVNKRDGHLGIQAWSLLDPAEPADDQ